MRGGGRARCYALGAVHSMGFWGPEKPQGQGRKEQGRGGTAQSALLGEDQSPVNHVQTRGGLPGSRSPHWWCAVLPNLPHPLQLWSESVQAGGGRASSLVAGAGQGLLPNTARPASRGRKDPS